MNGCYNSYVLYFTKLSVNIRPLTHNTHSFDCLQTVNNSSVIWKKLDIMVVIIIVPPLPQN